MTLVERLFEEIPGAEQVFQAMRSIAFERCLLPVRPWFEDVKIQGLYLTGFAELAVGYRVGYAQGYQTTPIQDTSKPALIIYPLKARIEALRLTSEDKGWCNLEKSSAAGSTISAGYLVGDYQLPHYVILEILYDALPLN